jgi:hypothetical protein
MGYPFEPLLIQGVVLFIIAACEQQEGTRGWDDLHQRRPAKWRLPEPVDLHLRRSGSDGASGRGAGDREVRRAQHQDPVTTPASEPRPHGVSVAPSGGILFGFTFSCAE